MILIGWHGSALSHCQRLSSSARRSAELDVAAVYEDLKTRPEGLTADEAATRLAQHGQNILAKDQRPGILMLVWRALRNPLVILIAALAMVSFATGDARAATMMLLMIALSVGLRLIQEAKASSAAAKLKAMISVKATVLRNGTACDIAVAHLVPGDVVQLTAGDMIPGDVRVVQAKDLFVIQGSLTGESFPVEKFVAEKKRDTSSPLELTTVAFLGTSVGSGAGVLGASVFVPFLPMQPIQILANNLIYDVGQAAIPTDAVDAERLQEPRTWDLKELTRFILFMGPCSSIFDYSTYLLMLYVFKCWDVSTPLAAAHSQSLFQTGWFVKSLPAIRHPRRSS